jgi:hypothetical protein
MVTIQKPSPQTRAQGDLIADGIAEAMDQERRDIWEAQSFALMQAVTAALEEGEPNERRRKALRWLRDELGLHVRTDVDENAIHGRQRERFGALMEQHEKTPR